MALQEQLDKLKGFDVSDLDPDNIGGWPLPLKALLWCLVFIAVVVASHQMVLQEKTLLLETEVQNEAKLKGDFEQKVQEAANIERYKEQMVDMEKSFSALLAQLPKDTEVPGLLDDITNKGLDSGLSFKGIDLKAERKAEFYVELPIEVRVVGGYHDFGTFISGVAGLPRIVTLHDFVIASSSDAAVKPKNGEDGNSRSDELTMTITARTYRYKSESDISDDKKAPKVPVATPAAAPVAGK